MTAWDRAMVQSDGCIDPKGKRTERPGAAGLQTGPVKLRFRTYRTLARRHTSRFFTSSAWSSMKRRRGSTCSPISVANRASARWA